jgi:hypothetical protein
LLRRCDDEFNFDEFDDPCQVQLQGDVKAFLSRAQGGAPAPRKRSYGARVPEHMVGYVVPSADTAATVSQLRADLARVEQERDEATAERYVYDRQAQEAERTQLRILAQLDETKAALEESQDVVRIQGNVVNLLERSRDFERTATEAHRLLEAAARAALEKLQRAWAVRELEHAPIIALQNTPNALEMWLASSPPEVTALIRSGAGLPMGECDRCGRRGPVCLWTPDDETWRNMGCPSKDMHSCPLEFPCWGGTAEGKEPADGE